MSPSVDFRRRRRRRRRRRLQVTRIMRPCRRRLIARRRRSSRARAAPLRETIGGCRRVFTYAVCFSPVLSAIGAVSVKRSVANDGGAPKSRTHFDCLRILRSARSLSLSFVRTPIARQLIYKRAYS